MRVWLDDERPTWQDALSACEDEGARWLGVHARTAAALYSGAAQWEQIPWQPELGPAITEARNQDKPILLWMMNGNPVGMT